MTSTTPTAGTRQSDRGTIKAILILLALGRDRAASVLEVMDAIDVDRIAAASGALPPLDATILGRTAKEFQNTLETSTTFLGTPEEVHDVLKAKSTPEVTSANAAKPAEPVWQRLERLGAARVAAYLAIQHPQVSAYALLKFPAGFRAEALSGLQPAVRNDLVVRMLRLQDAAPEIEQLLEVQLEQDLLNAGGAEKKHASIAEVLNCLATTESRQILTFIANERPEDARALEKLLFGFEDLVRLPPAGLTVLVDRVATEKIVLALSGAAADIQAAVLAAMAPRARRMVEMELQSGSPASSEVSAARRELAATALKLASEKLIQLPQRDDASTADE